jgi:hypothetical protein
MLFILLYNTEWSVGLVAERLGLRMRKSGHFGGWVNLSDLEELQDAGYRVRVF